MDAFILNILKNPEPAGEDDKWVGAIKKKGTTGILTLVYSRIYTINTLYSYV